MKVERRVVKDGWVQITTPDERYYYHEKSDRYYKSSSWVADYVHKGKGFTEWLKTVGNEAEKIMTDRGDAGNKVHQAIHVLVHRKHTEGKGYLDVMTEVFDTDTAQPSELTGEECEAVYSFCRWWEETEEKYNIEIIDYEVNGFNDQYQFAGTRDLRLKLQIKTPIVPNPKRKTQEEDLTGTWTIDYKTSKSIYPNHIAQISSYKRFEGCENDRLGILQVGYKLNKAGFKFTEVDDRFDLWLAAHVFWADENEGKQPKQYQIPTLIKI